MKYTIVIYVPIGVATRSVEVDVDSEGFPVPRVGEDLIFDDVELAVTQVRHWFNVGSPRELYVIAEPNAGYGDRLRKRWESKEIFDVLRRFSSVLDVRDAG